LPLFVLLSWWFLVRTLRSGSRRYFALCMVATSLALYTHNFAVYVPVVLATLVLISGQFFSRFRLWLLAVAIQVLVYAPWIPTFLRQLENQDHYAWFLGLWKKYGLLGVLERSFRSFAPTGAFVMSPGGEDTVLYGIPAAVATATAAWGAILLVKRWRDSSAADALWIPIALVVPIALSLAMSQVITPHYVPGRVDQMLLPAFVLLAATGIAGFGSTWLRRAIVPVLLGLSLIPMDYFIEKDGKKHYVTRGSDADMVKAVIALWKPKDVILCTSLTRAPLEYYLGQAGIEARILSFPRQTARHLGAQNDWRLVSDSKMLERETKAVLDEARRLTEPDGHLFELRAETEVNKSLLPAFLRRRHYVYPQVILGNFDQTGTGEVIAASLNRMHEPTAPARKAGTEGGEPDAGS
jgi:hypothetical protein